MPTVEYLDYEVLDDFGWSLDDDELFENAAAADLDDEAYGSFEVEGDDWILEAVEDEDLSWPFSCRVGACANCATVVVEGEIEMHFQQILSQEEIEEKDIQLTCIGEPVTETVKLVYNAKHIDYLHNHVV